MNYFKKKLNFRKNNKNYKSKKNKRNLKSKKNKRNLKSKRNKNKNKKNSLIRRNYLLGGSAATNSIPYEEHQILINEHFRSLKLKKKKITFNENPGFLRLKFTGDFLEDEFFSGISKDGIKSISVDLPMNNIIDFFGELYDELKKIGYGDSLLTIADKSLLTTNYSRLFEGMDGGKIGIDKLILNYQKLQTPLFTNQVPYELPDTVVVPVYGGAGDVAVHHPKKKKNQFFRWLKNKISKNNKIFPVITDDPIGQVPLRMATGTKIVDTRSIPQKIKVSEQFLADHIDKGVGKEFEFDSPKIIKMSNVPDGKEVLGSGAFGKVLKSRYTIEIANSFKYVDVDVAIKKIINADAADSALMVENLYGEATICTNVRNCKFICRCFGVVNPHSIDGYAVFEYCSKGSLLSYLKKKPRQLDFETQKKFILQICEAMECIHQKNYLHRDLATRNILLDEEYNIKIADFGLSKKIESENSKWGTEGIPVRWSSPECWLKREYYKQSDVLAFGCVIVEIIGMGKMPYYKYQNIQEVKSFIMDSNATYIDKIYDHLDGSTNLALWKGIVDDCTNPDYTKRYTFKELKIKIEEVKEPAEASGAATPEEASGPAIPEASGKGQTTEIEYVIQHTPIANILYAPVKTEYVKVGSITRIRVNEASNIQAYMKTSDLDKTDIPLYVMLNELSETPAGVSAAGVSAEKKFIKLITVPSPKKPIATIELGKGKGKGKVIEVEEIESETKKDELFEINIISKSSNQALPPGGLELPSGGTAPVTEPVDMVIISSPFVF